jgi:predicted acyltransferase
VAFLIRDKSFKFQLGLSLLLLLSIDLAYRYFPVEGFNHPWVPFENLGAWFNNTIEGVEKASIWSSLNVVSTTAHTIWGVLCGKLLMQEKPAQEKIQSLVLAGIFCMLLGYSLDLLDITPIIKKIATSSFVFASGGWAILVLAFSYKLIDVKHWFTKCAQFFIIVGSNSLFIYLFFNIGAAELIQHILAPFVKLLFAWTGEMSTQILTSCSVWMAMWGICYWLYQKKIFFKF